MTFYDFLEQMMMMGVLFSNDQVSTYSVENSPNFSNQALSIRSQDDPYEENNATPRSMRSSFKVEESNKSTQNDSRKGSPNASPLVIKNNKANIFSPCSNIKNIQDFDYSDIEQLVENMERRCLDLAQQIGYKFLTDATTQKEIAYLIVVTARRENGIVDYENDFLRDYYDVEIRNDSKFHNNVTRLLEECPDLSNQLLFDLVIRQYTRDGREIVPPFF